jgi:hypothetical protein
MSEQHKHNPEKVSTQTLAMIIRGSQNLLNNLGENKVLTGTERVVDTVTLPIESPALTGPVENTRPTVTISRPTGKLAQHARWAYEITYGMQDPNASRHILVLNGEVPEAEMAFYDGHTADRALTEQEGEALASDLTVLAETRL